MNPPAVLAVGAPFPALDLTAATAIAREAYSEYRDEALVWRRWDLMLLTEHERDWSKLHQEASNYLNGAAPNKMARGNAARVKILTYDLTEDKELRSAYAELEKYRNDKTLPRSVAVDIRRQLDAGDMRGARVIEKFLKRGLRTYGD